MNEQVVRLHKDAPEKPAVGAPCNGCGVCCAAETCPVARILYLRRQGPCPALRWVDDESRYRCELLQRAHRFVRPLLARSIAAGKGCDSGYEPVSPTTPAPTGKNQN